MPKLDYWNSVTVCPFVLVVFESLVCHRGRIIIIILCTYFCKFCYKCAAILHLMATLVDQPVNLNPLSIERLWRPRGHSMEFCMTASVMTRASQSDPFLLSYISLLGPRALSNIAGMVPITVLMCALSCQLLKWMRFRSGLFACKEKWEFNGCRCCSVCSGSDVSVWTLC